MNIYIKKDDYNNIMNHCIRKLKGNYLSDETKERQAFGIVVGEKLDDNNYIVTRIVNLKKNFRYDCETSKKMNSYIEKYAIPGGLEVSERAWSIDPIELSTILTTLESPEIFLGTYHMHSYLSWKGVFPKELPTKLDRELNIGSELVNFIVHITEEKQGIRAFYESNIDNEYKIFVLEEENSNES